jgi:hypothetical protein
MSLMNWSGLKGLLIGYLRYWMPLKLKHRLKDLRYAILN